MYRRPLSLRKNREKRRLWIAVVNRVPVYICINYFVVLSLTVEKARVGRKIALASVYRLAEHFHAMSVQNPDIRFLITVKPGQAYLPRSHWCIYYSKVEPLVVVDFRFISVCIFACVMSREFTRDLVTKFLPAQFPWILCKCLLRHLIHSKILNLTKCREFLLKYLLFITHTGMPI